MPQSIVRAYRGLFGLSIVRELRESHIHQNIMLDSRLAAEHEIANLRAREGGGEGCPFCS